MLPEVELHFHPTTTNCLAWSEDGELAIAAGEFVHILIPRRHRSGQEGTTMHSGPWDHVQFRVNTFNMEEWPVQEGASFDDFSIGEEQSTTTVTAISWSSCGLAKHRRPVLAVLTSNLILSCWASSSDPVVSVSWKRVLIINNAIRKWWDQRRLSDSNYALMEDGLRRKLRVRSMSWAPEACLPREKNPPLFATKQGDFLLAVANDAAEISLLLISSPYTTISTSWNCKIMKLLRITGDVLNDVQAHAHQTSLQELGVPPNVLKHPADLGEGNDEIHFHPSLFKFALARKRFIDHLAWGPWNFGDIAEIILTFSRNRDIFHCLFEVQFQVQNNKIFTEVVGIELKYSLRHESGGDVFGSSRVLWQGQDTNGEPYVAMCRGGEVSLLSWNRITSNLLPEHDGTCRLKPEKDRWGDSVARNFTKTNEPWDGFSGEPTAYLYLSTQLSHIEVFKIQRDVHKPRRTGLICEPLAPSTLERQMLKLRNRFDRREELGGLSIMKTWGLATLGGYIAVCITLHPGDMAEYYIPSQGRATLVFSTHGLTHPSAKRELFPWEADIQLRNSLDIQIAILDAVLDYERGENLLPSNLSNKIIYSAIMASTLVWDNARSERLRLAESAARRLSRSGEIDLSPEIECLNLLLSAKHDPISAKVQVKQATGSRSEEELSSTASRRLLDICTFCEQPVAWESLTDATCVAGHPFARCSLTFLAILEPGICKSCSRCNRAFLNEHTIRASIHDHDHDNDRERSRSTTQSSTLSLADILFEMYDTCPYCRGKFVG